MHNIELMTMAPNTTSAFTVRPSDVAESSNTVTHYKHVNVAIANAQQRYKTSCNITTHSE